MESYIYRCLKKPDMYIYLVEKGKFDIIPGRILNSLGIIEFAMQLEITPHTKLAREDTKIVLNNLNTHGFHLQLSASESVEIIMARIAHRSDTSP